ncbi:hypothetical protein ACHAXT_008656 [Thalassiosira profunda]
MEPPTATPLRVGILGCARIAKKNARAATFAGCKVSAVASRTQAKANDFVNDVLAPSQPPVVFAGDAAYDELLASGLCDAVYIPLPTKLHERYVAAALASKHVLLEKPVATSAESYRAMLAAASKNGKLLLDGTMFVHHPRTEAFVRSVPSPNRVTFNFTFDGGEDFLQNNIRCKKDADFMGCIGDLGWYCTRMGLLVFSEMDAGRLRGMTTKVQVTRYQLNEEGVPIDADCLVHFTGNRVLSFHCSFVHPLDQTAKIYATGHPYVATMTDAILPLKKSKLSFALTKQGIVQYDEITAEETKVIEIDNSLAQEVLMWKHFASWARKIDGESSVASAADQTNEKWWAGEGDEAREANAMASYSLHTQIVLDALMESIRLEGAAVEVKGA